MVLRDHLANGEGPTSLTGGAGSTEEHIAVALQGDPPGLACTVLVDLVLHLGAAILGTQLQLPVGVAAAGTGTDDVVFVRGRNRSRNDAQSKSCHQQQS